MDYLQVRAAYRNGLYVLRIAGDLDSLMADTFAVRADAALSAARGPVVVDLSGLAFTDARGARALAALLKSLSPGRLADVRYCPSHVRHLLDLIGLPPLNYFVARGGSAWEARTPELVDRLRRAMLDASEARHTASGVLGLLTDTCIRVASTRERTGLALEQGRRTVVNSKAARERLMRSRQGVTA